MKYFKLVFIIQLFIININYAAPRQIYNMSDLKALSSNNAYLEFFEHAKDIRPSKRDKDWQDMCLKMAKSFMNSYAKKDISEQDFQMISSVLSYPHFDKDELFIEKRERFLAKIIGRYAQNNLDEEVIKMTSKLYKEFKNTKYFGLYISENLWNTFKKNDVHNKHIDFFNDLLTPLTRSKFSEFYCHKSPTKDVLVYMIVKQSKRIQVHQDCQKKLIPSIESYLYQNNNQERKRAFKYLSSIKEIKPKDLATYHVLNLLNGKKIAKNNWDKTIDALNYFKENYTVRQSTMDILDKYDPYPDTYFNVYEKKQLKALTRILSKSFPEYIDRYAKDCLDYLSGKVVFRNGNPTPHCHRYMEISKESKSSPEQVLIQYDHIMNSWKNR